MSTDLLLTTGLICFGLTVAGMAMTILEFRNAEVAKQEC